MTEHLCTCGHPITMGMCWRLTCRTRGAGVSADHVRPASDNDKDRHMDAYQYGTVTTERLL